MGRGGNEAGIYFYIYYIDCFLVRRSPHRGTLENGSPGGFHECESLENLIHGTFILIAFSIFVISAEIGQGIFFLIWCIFELDCSDPLRINVVAWGIYIGCLEYWCTWDKQIYVVLGPQWGTIKISKSGLESGTWAVCRLEIKKHTHLSPSTLGVLKTWPFLKGSRNNFPSWFSRCNFDFYPIISYHFNTLYKRILEVGVATTSFRFRKSKSGGSAEWM